MHLFSLVHYLIQEAELVHSLISNRESPIVDGHIDGLLCAIVSRLTKDHTLVNWELLYSVRLEEVLVAQGILLQSGLVLLDILSDLIHLPGLSSKYVELDIFTVR